MKNKKRTIALLLSAIMLVAATFMSTVAYFTSRQSVVNTFTVGKVEIKLNEAKVDVYGQPVDENGAVVADKTAAPRVEQNSYKLVPGQTYVKDPQITVTKGSEECYVRMIVTFNRSLDQLKAIFGDDFLPQNYVNNTWDNTIWPCVKVAEDTTAGTVSYEFRYHEIVDARERAEDVKLEALFTEFAVPGAGIDADDLKELQDMTITVEGHAIQSIGLADADAAWLAFNDQWTKK